MKAKYLIQWTEYSYSEAESQDFQKKCAKVLILTDIELDEFLIDKDNIDVTFMCNVHDHDRSQLVKKS